MEPVGRATYHVSLPLVFQKFIHRHISAWPIFWKPFLWLYPPSEALHCLLTQFKFLNLTLSLPLSQPAFGPLFPRESEWGTCTELVFAHVKSPLSRRPSSTPTLLKLSLCGILSIILSVPYHYYPVRSPQSLLDLLEHFGWGSLVSLTPVKLAGYNSLLHQCNSNCSAIASSPVVC